jgi:hypothetical protein
MVYVERWPCGLSHSSGQAAGRHQLEDDVADNATGLNAQYADKPFGLGGDYLSSGAPGSPGVTVSDPDATVATVPVHSSPYWSAQADPAPDVTVGVGDTSGFSDDTPIHESALLPHGEEALTTGAGDGHAGHFAHPNSGGGY